MKWGSTFPKTETNWKGQNDTDGLLSVTRGLAGKLPSTYYGKKNSLLRSTGNNRLKNQSRIKKRALAAATSKPSTLPAAPELRLEQDDDEQVSLRTAYWGRRSLNPTPIATMTLPRAGGVTTSSRVIAAGAAAFRYQDVSVPAVKFHSMSSWLPTTCSKTHHSNVYSRRRSASVAWRKTTLLGRWS